MFKHFKFLLAIITAFSVSFFIWAMVSVFFLEKLPLKCESTQKIRNFYIVHLDKLFFEKYIPKVVKIEPLKGVKLKAIFENGKNSFIIIENKNDIFVDLGSTYKGYKLIKVTKNSAIFEKNHKQFILTLKDEKVKEIERKVLNKKVKEVKKEIFKDYINHPEKVWSSIGIIQTKKGYKVTYVKYRSIFDKLGLKRGDYILEVNNQPLKNDSDAWNIYKDAKYFDEIDVKIKRNNKIKELNYEIR